MTRVTVTCLCLIGAVSAFAGGCGGSGDESGALYCYIGGTMGPAMEALKSQYEKETGQKVVLDAGDSGASLIKAETTGKGDLIVVHDPFHGAAVKKGLSQDAWVLATVETVIVVAKGNPKKLEGLKDLGRPGLRVILTDPVYSTAGHVNQVMFAKAGVAAQIAKNVVTQTRSGGEAANAVVLGHADAAIVWNAVAFLRKDKLDAIPIEPPYRATPGVDAITSATFGPIDMGHIRVTMDVLKSSKQAAKARTFAEFCASPKNQEVWIRFGFGPAPAGDAHRGASIGPPAPKAAAPPGAAGEVSLLLYCGAGLQPAVADLARAFTEKTGVRIETDFGGSGLIISRLRLAQRGDLFMPGDVWYVELAEKEGLVASKELVCYFVPVLLVPKGNPKKIEGLSDLARPGLRIGLGRPEACQIGQASVQLFEKNKLDRAAIEKNLVFSATTVEELGLQVKTGKLDATIVWDAVAAQYADSADAVPIPAEQNVISRVAVAVLKSTTHRPEADKFVEFLRSGEGQAIFTRHHYRTEPPR